MISDHSRHDLIKAFSPQSLIQPAEEEVAAAANQVKGNLCLPLWNSAQLEIQEILVPREWHQTDAQHTDTHN